MLYVADVPDTAVAELRARVPQEPISLCRVRTARDVRVLDLVDGYPRINPFTESEETLFWEVEIAELLILFGEELAKPVQNDDDPQEYRTTQQLCAAVRDAGEIVFKRFKEGTRPRSSDFRRATTVLPSRPGRLTRSRSPGRTRCLAMAQRRA